MTEEELKEQQDEYNTNVDQRKDAAVSAGTAMPRKPKYPRMLYACACVGMRAMQGDAANSNCKDCRARGTVEVVVKDGKEVSNCPTCLCPCVVGQFVEKNIQAIAVHAAEKSALKQRKVNPQAQGNRSSWTNNARRVRHGRHWASRHRFLGQPSLGCHQQHLEQGD